ncbi:hypothetical protein [Streptomyces aureus]|uniref:Uncharacterized protein n=1 Tax=Streptomyces aureus TaxID=193461 RepID=A0ABV4SWY1_9ACTN
MREIPVAGAGGVDAPAYLVTLRGEFSDILPSDGPVRSGIWAALFIDPDSLRTRGFTARPAEDVPQHRLENLGHAHGLAL